MSGYNCSKQEIAPVPLPAMGRLKVLDLGGNVQKAPTIKLIGNPMIVVFTLSEKAGIGAPLVHQYIKNVVPASPLINNGEKKLHDQFDGRNRIAIDSGLKDSAHIRRQR